MRIFLLLIISIFCMMGCNPKTQNSIEPKADSVASSTESSHPTESDNSSESINQFLSLESESSKKAMEIVIHYAQESIDHKKDLGFIVSVITKDGVSVRSLGDLADLPSPLSAIVAALPEKQLGIAILSDTSSEFSTMVAILGLSQLLGESRDHLQKVSDRVFTADKIVLAKPD